MSLFIVGRVTYINDEVQSRYLVDRVSMGHREDPKLGQPLMLSMKRHNRLVDLMCMTSIFTPISTIVLCRSRDPVRLDNGLGD